MIKEKTFLDELCNLSRYIVLPWLLALFSIDILFIIYSVILKVFDIFTILIPLSMIVIFIVIKDVTLNFYSRANLLYLLALLVGLIFALIRIN